VAEWITYAEALERIPVRTVFPPSSEPNFEADIRYIQIAEHRRRCLLDELIAMKVVASKDAPENMRVKHLVVERDVSVEMLPPAKGTLVDGIELDVWVRRARAGEIPGTSDNGQNERPVTPPNRTARDRSMSVADAPLVQEMRSLIQGGKASSPSAAALHVVDRAAGSGTTVSKQRRLERRYHRTYGVT